MDWDLDEAKKTKIPLALAAGGWLLMFVRLWIHDDGVAAAFSGGAIRILFALALGYLGCAILAKAMKVDFGERKEAGPKLAGVIGLSAGVCVLLPWVGWVLAIVVCAWLAKWFFELEPKPLLVSTAVIMAAEFLALWMGAGLSGWLNG